MQTLIRRRIRRRLIWVCTVGLCPINGTLGIIELREKVIKADSVLKHKGAHVAKRQDYKIKYNVWMDGWMTCDFTSFSTVFQSYQDDGQMIMKGCVQWNPVYG